MKANKVELMFGFIDIWQENKQTERMFGKEAIMNKSNRQPKRVTDLITNRGVYVIVEYMNGYAAIDRNDIKNGKITKSLNGLQMHWTRSVSDTINEVVRIDKIRDLMDAGMTAEKAVREVFKQEGVIK